MSPTCDATIHPPWAEPVACVFFQTVLAHTSTSDGISQSWGISETAGLREGLIRTKDFNEYTPYGSSRRVPLFLRQVPRGRL